LVQKVCLLRFAFTLIIDELPSEKGLILFGPSGSGKTWLAGGLFSDILSRLLATYPTPKYKVSISAYEFGITGTNIYDLCDQKAPGVPTSKTSSAARVPAKEIFVKTTSQIGGIWKSILSLRSTGSTSNNATSSRRHAVFQMVSHFRVRVIQG
jgi:hypothetical protein